MGAINKLTDTKIKAVIRQAVSTAKVKKIQDGGNLFLIARPSGIASFVYKYSRGAKRPELGLGPYPIVTLANAREERDKWQKVRRDGLDPEREREKQRRENSFSDNTLSVVANLYYQSIEAGLKDGGPTWMSALNNHVLPEIGHLLVTEVNQNDIVRALKPIWNTSHPTALVALKRLNLVVKHAVAMGENVKNINVTDMAKALLGETAYQKAHHGSVSFAEVPALYQSIPESEQKYLALKFSILVPNVRTNPIRCLRLCEISSDGVWTVPSENLKGRLNKIGDSTIILSDEALRIVELARPYANDDYLFANSHGGPMGKSTMRRALSEFNSDATIHGFRSSLATWLETLANVPDNVKLSLLNHKVGNSTQSAYNRSEYINERKRVMDMWEAHCLSQTGKVVQLAEASANG